MTLTNRKKVLDAGFQIYHQNTRRLIISRASTRGGWFRHGNYSTLAGLRKRWSEIMADPMAIDD